MYRFFFRFVVTTLTILTANLLATVISDFMISYKNHYKPLAFTLIGMVIIIMVFYPLFMKLEKWVKRFSVKVIKSGHSFAGRYLWLSFTFLGGFLVLFYFYSRMWYHIDFLQVLLRGNLGAYM